MLLNSAETAFRDEVRAFLATELTPELRTAGRRSSGIFTDHAPAIAWHRILARRGWSVPTWPVEHGGTGWSPMQHHVFARELAAAQAPAFAPMGPRMVAPVIIHFGTPEQKARWLPGIRNGDDYWAQGYSEPGAGSDLASLQCRAVRDGHAYVINGSKIWTTHAHWANRIFCLVRTRSDGKPQQGISFLCFDLTLPGITVRPITSISGDHEFNQVFFDDVRVPLDALVGEENQGWTVAKYLLQHERGHAWGPMLRGRLTRMHAALQASQAEGARDATEVADLHLRLIDAECQLEALEALEMQALAARIRGDAPGLAPSIGKVLATELRQHMTELAVEIAGPYAQANLTMAECADDAQTPLPEEAVYAMSIYLNDRAASIYAGTNEVQRNLISQQLLAH